MSNPEWQIKESQTYQTRKVEFEGSTDDIQKVVNGVGEVLKRDPSQGKSIPGSGVRAITSYSFKEIPPLLHYYSFMTGTVWLEDFIEADITTQWNFVHFPERLGND